MTSTVIKKPFMQVGIGRRKDTNPEWYKRQNHISPHRVDPMGECFSLTCTKTSVKGVACSHRITEISNTSFFPSSVLAEENKSVLSALHIRRKKDFILMVVLGGFVFVFRRTCVLFTLSTPSKRCDCTSSFKSSGFKNNTKHCPFPQWKGSILEWQLGKVDWPCSFFLSFYFLFAVPNKYWDRSSSISHLASLVITEMYQENSSCISHLSHHQFFPSIICILL